MHPPAAIAALQTYYAKSNDNDDADLAYIEERHLRRPSNWLLNVVDQAAYLVSGYGRDPEKALYSIVTFLCLGALFFSSRKYMISTSQPNETGQHYFPVLYSLGTFIPIVKVGGSSEWRPRTVRDAAPDGLKCNRLWCHWLSIYWTCHVLAGWILIPLILAAFAAHR